jgi:putative endonuclease
VSRRGRAFGQAAESAAERLLRSKGYRILARNFRTALGELDLVAETKGVLVFVEVKARRTAAFGGPVAAVDGRKQRRLIRLAAHYRAQRGMTEQPCRFDVVLCTGDQEKPASLEHIEHAFEVPGDAGQW